MKKIYFILFEILIFAFFTIFLPFIFIKERPVINQESGTNQISLINNKTFVYQFSHPQYLNSISLQLKNPLIKNNSQINIELTDSNGKNIKGFSFSGSNIGDPSWLEMKFDPLTDTIYQILVSSNNQIPESLFLLTDSKGKWDLKTTIKTNQFKPNIFSISPKYIFSYFFIIFILNWYFIKNEK